MKIEERLREELSRRASRVGTDDGAWESIRARLDARPRRRPLSVGIAAVVAAGVTAAALAGLWLALRHDAPSPGPAAPVLSPRVTDVVSVGPWPGVIAVGEGSAWVAVRSDSPPDQELVRIDQTTDRVVDRIPLDVNDVVVAFGSVWASTNASTGGTSVVRIDPATGEVVATFEGMGGQWSLAAGEGAVWVLTAAEGESVLSRIDPATNEAAHWVTVIGETRGVAAGEGAVWLALEGTHQGTGVVRVDPVTRSVADPVEASFTSLAVGQGYVWVQLISGDRVRRIDPITDAPVEPSIPFADAFRSFDAGEGGVWFIGGPGGTQGICRLNADTLEVDSCVQVSSYADTALSWPAALDAENDTIWVANYRNTVTRIDLRSGRPVVHASQLGSGGSCLSADQPGLISCQEAIEAARQEGSYPDEAPIARLIDYRAHPGDSPIRAWMMTYPCVKLMLHGGPVFASPRGPTYGPWDVVIDAHTGAFKVEGTARGKQSSTPCPPIPGG